MIIQRYIQEEILSRFFWLTGLLILIYISHRFIDFLAISAAGGLSSSFILKMLWLKLIYVLPKLLPVTLFFAVILTYSQLVKDNELIIMQSGGWGQIKQIKIMLALVVPMALLVMAIALFISPLSEFKFNELKHRARHDADINSISAGQFKEFGGNELIAYITSLSADKKIMEDVFLQLRRDEKLILLKADKAELISNQQTGQRHIKFSNGRQYIIPNEGLGYNITDYQNYTILLDTDKSLDVAQKTKSIPTSTLWFSTVKEHQIEIQWRASPGLACLLLPLLGLLLGFLPVAEKRYLLILTAIFSYFAYNNLLSISKSLSEQGLIPSTIGLWWVHATLLIILFILYRRSENQTLFGKVI